MYTHITRDDRVVISDGLRRSESYATIGDRIGKDKGAVWREAERNKGPDGQYRVWFADRRARQRRKQSKYGKRKIENNAVLQTYIEARSSPCLA